MVAEDERVPVPVGEYVMEDGKILKVVEEGIIAEIADATTEEAPTEEAPVEEEELQEETTAPKKIVKSISEEMFFSEIEKLRQKLAS